MTYILYEMHINKCIYNYIYSAAAVLLQRGFSGGAAAASRHRCVQRQQRQPTKEAAATGETISK